MLSRTSEGERALQRFVEAGMEAGQVGDLSAVLHHRGRGIGRTRRGQLVEFLVGLAPGDELATLCVLVTLCPELTWMSRLSVRGPVDPDEAEADVVAVAWEAVTKPQECGGETIGHAALVNAIWTEVRRSAGLRRRRGFEIVPLADGFDQPAPEVDQAERWPGLLATAVAHGVLTPRQVVLIAQTRMDRRPLSEVARALGRPYDAVRKERRRAEAALRDFATSHICSEEG
jgi:DNA-directed RNA polymerase specialized sigma24 family protein